MDEYHSEPWYRSAQWMQQFEAREQEQIIHAIAYARDHASAGAPGHGQFLLIAKLATLLFNNPVSGLVERSRVAAIAEVMEATELLATAMGWPCIDSDRADDNFVMTFKQGGLL